MLGFRELESSNLYAGLGVQLIDEFASVPSANVEAPPLGWATIEIDIDDGGGTYRTLDPGVLVTMRTPSGVVWYPWLERHADARLLVARNYRVRVSAGVYAPRYAYDSDGVVVAVSPYDDNNPPAAIAVAPTKILLLPTATYPFAPAVPILRGLVIDTSNAPVPNALVSWIDAALQTDAVLTDADGEFALPMRRAAINTPIDIHAERPGLAGDTIIRIPQDLSISHTIQIS
ncbi:MAG TPA: carboxypeptidase-like regulatory domain-containing protein [Kofleriaceae bacterium]